MVGGLSTVYRQLGETAKVIEYYDSQLVNVREIGDRSSEGIALNNTDVIYEELGRIEEARAV